MNYTLPTTEIVRQFHTSYNDIIGRFNLLRDLERRGEWRTAAELWKTMGKEYQMHVDSCNMIADAVEHGDRIRARKKPLLDWVEQTVENGVMSRDEALKIVYPEMLRIDIETA